MIKKKIDQDLKTAMLAGDKKRVSVLRGLKSVILYDEVASGSRDKGLEDSDIIPILQKELKKRVDAAQLYEGVNEDERYENECYEQAIIESYLPKQLSENEITALIMEPITQFPEPVGMQEMGKIIGLVKKKVRGSADGATIARLVKEKLTT